MVLGAVLLLGVMSLSKAAGANESTRDLVSCMITYTLMASLLATSFLSMVVTRFTADMLYEDRKNAILPSFWGSVLITMVIGSVVYGIFLLFSGATRGQQFLLFLFFNELVITWNAMSYLSAIKDYKGIFLSYACSVAVVFLAGWGLTYAGVSVVDAMLIAVTVGYGVMALWNVILLRSYFPDSKVSPFLFLKWMDKYFPLALTGLFANVGMYAHLIIVWFGPMGVRIEGLFWAAPYYHVPAFVAFLTTLVTTVNFVVSVEVNFYPKYKIHYALYNEKGTVKDIMQAEKEMLTTLKIELFYTAVKQLICTALFITIGGLIIDSLPLGFTEIMRGYFRVLCVAYGLYAVGNMIMLIQLYFTDYQGALLSTGLFAGSGVLLNVIGLWLPSVYYGFGFLISSALYAGIALLLLDSYTRKLPYYILAAHPLVEERKTGFFEKVEQFLENKLCVEDP